MADSKYLIIGGGVASAKAAVAIRERDKDGVVVLVTAEQHFPYDRPPLSKAFLLDDAMTPEDPESKAPAWYPANGVEVRQGTVAKRIDRAARRVTLEDGGDIAYEKLILCTGASPIRPNIEGVNLANVFCLRSVEDASAIRAAIRRGGRAVVIGGGFIGLEVAAAATTRGVACTIIDRNVRPWSGFSSNGAGEFVRGRFEAAGVTYLRDSNAVRLVGEGEVRAVRTLAGQELGADFVVVGVGVRLNTELAREAGLTLDANGAVVVDRFLRTSDPDIYAAGDIAAFPDARTGQRAHIAHYLNASWQGEVAGSNVADAGLPYERVAYLFSDMFDIHVALRGSPGGTFARRFGSVESGNFVEIYSGEGAAVQMGLAVTSDEPKLDPMSDRLEALIEGRVTIDKIDPADFAVSA